MQKPTEQSMSHLKRLGRYLKKHFCLVHRFVREDPQQTLCGGTCMVTVTMWCLKTQKHDGDGDDAQCTLSQSVQSHAMNHLLSNARPARSMFADFGRTGSPMARTRRRWVGCRLRPRTRPLAERRQDHHATPSRWSCAISQCHQHGLGTPRPVLDVGHPSPSHRTMTLVVTHAPLTEKLWTWDRAECQPVRHPLAASGGGGERQPDRTNKVDQTPSLPTNSECEKNPTQRMGSEHD